VRTLEMITLICKHTAVQCPENFCLPKQLMALEHSEIAFTVPYQGDCEMTIQPYLVTFFFSLQSYKDN